MRRVTVPRAATGSYITITQNIVDFDSPTASSAARAARNSSYKVILKQSAKEFAKYNQLYPDQFTQMQRDMINSFGSAKDQWFSSFMLQVEAHTSGIVCSSIPQPRNVLLKRGRFRVHQRSQKQGTDIHDAVYELASRNFPAEMFDLEARIAHDNIRNVA